MISFKNNIKKSALSFKVIVVCLLLSGSLIAPGYTNGTPVLTNGKYNCNTGVLEANQLVTTGYFTITNDVVTGNTACTGAVIIPNGVTSIGNDAFYFATANTALTSVTIPNSVTSIGINAFYNNSALTSVIIPNSVISIGGYAFFGTALTSVTIPNSVLSIDSAAFESNTRLASVTIGNSVITIGDNAFKNNTLLTSVTIGNSVTSIGTSAFQGNTALTSVTFLRISALSDDAVGYFAFSGVAEGAIANVAYNATGFPPDGDDWKGLIVRYASAPIGDSGSSSSNVATITPAVVKTADASFKLTNRKYLSKFEIRKAITKGRSFKRKPIDIYKYSISKTSKKTCIMRGNYVMALKKTGSCDLYATRTTPKGAKYKYWVKIIYSN
jgi:hypothetical protein